MVHTQLIIVFKSEENVGELGRTSLKSRHAVNVIRHWFNTKYVKICFL